ncbi:MAG: hypothetical protein ACPGVO_06280 [Spirulinaceae cyanobacterium]
MSIAVQWLQLQEQAIAHLIPLDPIEEIFSWSHPPDSTAYAEDRGNMSDTRKRGDRH